MKFASVLILLASSYAVAQSSRSGSSDLPDEYEAIVERNMFLRDRQRPPEPSTQPTTRRVIETPPDVPERRFVLRGIVIEDGALRAYIENTRGGVTRVAPGDAVATGHVVEIAIDAVAYAWPDGVIKWVEIGQNLEGVRQSAPPPPVASSSTSPSSTSPTPGNTSSGESAGTGTSGSTDTANMSLEERMRLRNQQRRR